MPLQHCLKWPHLSRSFHFLVPPFTMLLLSRVLTVCSALGSTCLLACPLEVDGPIGDNLPSFLMLLLVGVILLPLPPPAAPPSQMSKRSSSIPAGRTNRAKYRNENQSHQRRKDGRYEIGMGSTEAAVGRTTESVGRTDGRTDGSIPMGDLGGGWKVYGGKKFLCPLLFLLFLPLFFIFLTFSRPCQPPLFSFGVHHSKTYVSAKFLRMFDMKM